MKEELEKLLFSRADLWDDQFQRSDVGQAAANRIGVVGYLWNTAMTALVVAVVQRRGQDDLIGTMQPQQYRAASDVTQIALCVAPVPDKTNFPGQPSA